MNGPGTEDSAMCRHSPLARLVVLAALLAAGCGGSRETGTLTGKIVALNQDTGKLEPVAFARVYCHHVETDRVYAGLALQGSYEVRGVPVGQVKIIVDSPSPESREPDDPVEDTRLKVDAGKWFPLPEKYRHADTTPLGTVIQPGIQSLDLELR